MNSEKLNPDSTEEVIAETSVPADVVGGVAYAEAISGQSLLEAPRTVPHLPQNIILGEN